MIAVTLMDVQLKLEGLAALPLHSLRNHFSETVVFGDEFVEPETRTYFYRLYI